MNELRKLASIHGQHGIVVDTNILLLLVVGLAGAEYIVSFKRTAVFSKEDFFVLKNALSFFRVRLVTPHILAEVSSLTGQCSNPRPAVLRRILRTLVPDYREVARDSSTLAATPEFLTFGITDAAIADLAQGGSVVLTDDSELYHYLSGKGRCAVNFNHLRAYAKDE